MTRRRAGEPQLRGRLDRAEGRLRLAAGLAAPGQLPLAEALERIVADWQRQAAIGQVSNEAVWFYEKTSRALVSFALAAGCVTLADLTQPVVLVWTRSPKKRDAGSPVTVNTQYSRRSAARAFFTTAVCLGLHDSNPAHDVVIDLRPARYVNPLTADQVEQLKRTAAYRLGETKTPAALALCLCGATTGEVPSVAVRDIDLAHRQVFIGTSTALSRNRWARIDDDWCLTALADRISALAAVTQPHLLGKRVVAYDPGAGSRSPGAATAGALTALMKKARVYRPGINRVESIREYVAMQTFAETGSIPAVAARLGMASLDIAAHLVVYDWVTAESPTTPMPSWAPTAAPRRENNPTARP